MDTESDRFGSGKRFSALLTDLYQLTMACAYWKSGTANKEAVFHLSFRQAPFKGGFTVACGLEAAMEYLRDFRFEPADLAYLEQVPGRDGKPLFGADFLAFLAQLRFECDVDAVPEGTVVFPHEPLLRVQGPILQAQIVETALLTILNFESLIATKAARVCLAAGGDPVVEFGLRRAQGIDGGLTASRAAYVGGCAATSNLLAGQRYGIPVVGTHAHSWVMSFPSEREAFAAYAAAMPHNCILLVDTYDSLDGVRHAVEVGRELRRKGGELAGIRLDSGDLAYLSTEARTVLDEAGFPQAVIVGSNDLDEHIIASLKQQEAAINVWGVGTRLVTAYDQPALGGVYKLSALRSPGNAWEYKVKLSEQSAKITNPGILQVRRFRLGSEFIGDAIFDTLRPPSENVVIVDPADPMRRKQLDPSSQHEDLLVPVFRGGKQIYQPPDLNEVRGYVQNQLASFHPGIKRTLNPHRYPAGLELGLHETKTGLALAARPQPHQQ
jgi:nicotinate phosphoribosyltransferase